MRCHQCKAWSESGTICRECGHDNGTILVLPIRKKKVIVAEPVKASKKKHK